MKREQRMYKWNHRPEYAVLTPTMEDYLQTIYLLSGERGYAHVRDIADSINVLPSSVTRMIKKIDKAGFGIYEKYRGINLTLKGTKIAEALVKKIKC
jgi:Mn-dependent DtxR family transcriptional regulator